MFFTKIVIKLIELDRRVYVPLENLRFIHNDGMSVIGYRIKKIRLRDIVRIIDNKRINIKDTEAYHYLNDNSRYKLEYESYCKEKTNLYEGHSVDSFNKLIEKMESDMYSITKGAIIILKDNVIVDGFHRCCYLLSKYGEEYEIEVLQLVNLGYYKGIICKMLRK